MENKEKPKITDSNNQEQMFELEEGEEQIKLIPDIKSSTEINQIVNEIKMSYYHYQLLFLGLVFCFADGSEMVVVSLIMRKLEAHWHLDPLKKAFMGGSVFYGFLVGALISGKLMDSKGRKYSLKLGSVIFLVFGILSAFAQEFYTFIIYRIGVGFGIGFVIPTIQTFITEVSPLEYRGFNSVIIWMGFPLGELYTCLLAKRFPLDNVVSHQSNWKILLILAGLPMALNIFTLFSMKESPRFYLMKNKFDEAFEILNFLRKLSGFNDLSEKEKADLKTFFILKKSQSLSPTYSSLFEKKNLKFSINLWIMWFVVSYVFYGVLYLIPELLGKDNKNLNYNDLINAVVLSTVYECVGILLAFIMEIKYLGRIGAFKISFSLCFLVSLLCIYFPLHLNYFIQILKGTIQISNRCLYTYTTEVYPTEIRGIALGLANVFTRIAGLSTPIINEILLSFSRKYAFFGLTLTSFIAVISSFMLKKETLNLHLDS